MTTAVVGGCLLFLVGCGPSAIQPTEVDASASATAAMTALDKNSDGNLDDEELAAAPGILRAKEMYDKNGDGKVSKDELSERFATWTSTGVAMLGFNAKVVNKSKPIEGAEVTLEKESFIDGNLKTAKGVSGPGGMVVPKIPDDQLPEDQRAYSGVNPGLYKVIIVYEGQTYTLGQEVGTDSRDETIVFDLSEAKK